MTAKTRSKAPMPPYTSPHICSLARQELRDAAEAYECAKSRQAQAVKVLPTLTGAERTTVDALLERAQDTMRHADAAIASTLLLLWGAAADYDEARGNATPPPWEPCGAHVEDHLVWIAPGELDGAMDYDPSSARVTVITLEDLSTDEEEEALLASPPCRLLRITNREEASVIPAWAPA